MKQISEVQMFAIKKFAKKAEVLYDFFDWKWRDSEYPPKARNIEKVIVSLIEDLKTYNTDTIYSGGITVEKDEDMYTIKFTKEFITYI